MSGRIIVVSNRLPLSIAEHDGKLTADRSIGGVATALSSVFTRYDPLWVGWTGVRRELSDKELKSLELPEAIVPVQVPEELIEQYYDRVSNQFLWPGLHGLEPAIIPSESDWAGFLEVTTLFATTIQQLIQPEDIIWIHDSHLILLPQVLRDKGVTNRIGFFAHTPFPPAAHFVALPRVRSILQSLCQANVLGLQTARDVDAFWEALQQTQLALQPDLVRAFPIGVDYDLYRQASARADVQECFEGIRAKVAGKRMLLSVSRLDYTKGIIGQLKGVERFLQDHIYPQQFIYTLIVAPSRESVAEYQQLRQDITDEVTRINTRLGRGNWQPVDYQYRNIDFPEVVAHYLAADVLLLAPPIDGMNLIAKEFIATRPEGGALVLGQAVGAAFQLRDAVLIDALDIREIASGITYAFGMSDVERAERWQNLTSIVRKEDIFWWAKRFIRELEPRDEP